MCKSHRVHVAAESLDEVVREWNRLNDPNKKDTFAPLRNLCGIFQAGFERLGGRIQREQQLREHNVRRKRNARRVWRRRRPVEESDSTGEQA